MNSFNMALHAHSSDIALGSGIEESPLLLPQRAMEKTATSMEEDSAPVASTSKMAYSPLQSFKTAPLASDPLHSQNILGRHAHDQAINPSLDDPIMRQASPTSPSMPLLPTSSAKGKGRASDASAPVQASSEHSSHPLVLPDPFQTSDMERLRVENQLLKKQLAILVKKQSASHHMVSQHQQPSSATSIRDPSSRQLEEVNRMLRTSEAQRKRLEKELRYLRSYLLSSVEPYRLPTPDSESDNDDHRPRYDSAEIAEREDMERGEASVEPRKRQRRSSNTDARHVFKRKQTMGDAETEHLLLASARLSRLRKVVDLHPHSELSHLPQARRSHVQFPPASNSNREADSHVNGHEGQQHEPERLPPLPIAWTEYQEEVSPPVASSSASPSRRPIPLSAVLDSPIRTTRIKVEHESPRVNLSNAASIFQSSSPANLNNHPVAPSMQPSTSTTSSGKGERKIGRPLGSPNKTKLVSINNTAANRRRSKATDFASSNGGRGRGRGRPSAAPSGRDRSETQDPAASVDELLMAAQSLYGHEADMDMGHGAEGEESWQERIWEEDTNNGWQVPTEGEYTEPSAPKAVPYPPATPASLQEPDMTRFPHPVPIPSASGLPATPGRPRTTSNGSSSLLPPRTPNTIARNERSALDVLAEEAASASKGPGTLSGARNLETLGGSARNLAQEMEMARQSPKSMAGFPANASANVYSGYDYTAHQPPQDIHQFLGAAFSPHLQQQQDSSDPVEEGDSEEHPGGPMTIAEQLAQGVDISHPLIDLEDIQAGMTPAAALAKKSRSPYIKWSLEEDELLVQGVAEYGTKWEAVARKIPSRSYHQCRQRWLRGLKSGEALPPTMQHLKPQIDKAVKAYEQGRSAALKKFET